MLKFATPTFVWLCLIFIQQGSGLCPSQCKCDEVRLRSDCSEGKLEIVPIFLNPRMKFLEAQQNQIRHLEGALNVYEDLEVLDLAHNEFHSIGQYQFVSQLKLQQLNLSNNFIASLHSSTFEGPRALQILDLSHNILGSIHNDTFASLVSLVELRLSYNKIGSISLEAFSGLSRLRVLNLDHNLLESIDPTWMFALENLRFFYLSHNLLTRIGDDSFRPLSALKVLSVLQNRVFNVSQFAFRGLRSLDTLDLSDNLLPYVPNQSLSQLQQLLRLHLAGNPITRIERQSFQSLFTLEELDVSRMPKLEAVGGHSLMDNTNLKKLTLENNPVLGSLPWGLFATNSLLQEVSFRNNSWTTLAVQQVPHQSLHQLKIEGLPFHCNCSLIWLWELYQRQNETNIQLDVAKCATRPSSASDGGNSESDLELMSPDQLACDDWTHILVIISASVIGVVLILLAASLCLYKFRVFQMKSKYGGTPCFHIKDDTMIYRGTLGTPVGPFKVLPGSEQDQSGSYSPTEPFYEVPKYGDEDPKSSSASSGSKYSSSGYVGSELWENEYFSTGQSPAHCYVNPTSTQHAPGSGPMAHSRTLQRNYGGSPQSSNSGLGSGSSSSTASNGSTRLFFSPAHHGSPRNNGYMTSLNNHRGVNGNHSTLMWVPHGSPSSNKQFVPMDKFSTGNFRNVDILAQANEESLIDIPTSQQQQQQQQQQLQQRALFSSPNKSGGTVKSPKDRQFRPNVYV